MQALAGKAAAESTDEFPEISRRCGDIIREEYHKYVCDLKCKLMGLPRCSKEWWRVSSELLDNVVPRAGPPSLRDVTGEWAHDPVSMANLFAGTFQRKNALPPEVEDIHVEEPADVMKDFVPLRVRTTMRVLKELREDQATGPGRLGAKVLRRCSAQLALPVTLLARRILDRRCWPRSCKLHWVSRLHKRGNVFDPGQYRGMHLTPVLSKVVERLLAIPIGNFCAVTCAFGRSQWAFQKGIGCRDLISVLLCRWLLAFQERRKLGCIYPILAAHLIVCTAHGCCGSCVGQISILGI